MKRDEGDWKWSLNSTGHILDRFWLVGAVNCVSKQTSLREASKGKKRSTPRSQLTISQKYNCVWNLFCHYAIFIQQALEALLLYETPSQQTPDEMEITRFSALLCVLIDPRSTNLKSLRWVGFKFKGGLTYFACIRRMPCRPLSFTIPIQCVYNVQLSFTQCLQCE